jgi:hypothetical protein
LQFSTSANENFPLLVCHLVTIPFFRHGTGTASCQEPTQSWPCLRRDANILNYLTIKIHEARGIRGLLSLCATISLLVLLFAALYRHVFQIIYHISSASLVQC